MAKTELPHSTSGSRAGGRGHVAWVWLAVAVGVGLFSTGPLAIPIATWLAPAFMLRFVRSQRPVRGYLIAAAASIPVLLTAWHVFPFGGAIGLAIFAVIASSVGALPLLLDRWLAPAAPGLLRTLAYPVAVAGMEFLGGLNGDLGSWGAVGYTQLDVAPLAQLVSVTGLPGLAFLIAWFAAVVNELWEAGFELRSSKRPIAMFGGVLALVLAAGGLRIALVAPLRQSVRVAGISAPHFSAFPDSDMARRYRSGAALSPADLDSVRAHNAGKTDRLFERTLAEALAGAKVIAWAEAGAVVLDVDEAAFLRRAGSVAKQANATLLMGVGVLATSPAANQLRNKAITVSPDGEVVAEYLKTYPTPGGERAWSARGDGKLIVYESPVGRLASVICYDLDFPRLLHQASAADVGLLIVPAADWPAVARMHADMARMRAIEQGVAILRPASAGLSTAIDPYGTVLAAHPFVDEDIASFTAQIPLQRVRTIYGLVGDAFGWSVALALAGWLVAGLVGRLRRHRRSSRGPEAVRPGAVP